MAPTEQQCKALVSRKSGYALFYGYIVVLSAVAIFVAAFGVHYAFGVFFKPILREFGWSRTLISGAFSLSWLIHGLASVYMGRLNDRYGPRMVLILAGVLLSGGYLLITRITAAWQLYLFYGVLVGIGTGGIFVPLVSTIARWFIDRRTMMTGIAVAGVGLGTFMIPPLANQLISLYGWRTAYSILGISVFIVMVCAASFLKRDPGLINQRPYRRRKAPEPESAVDSGGYSLSEAMRTGQFWLAGGLLFCFGFFTYAILVHIAPYTTDKGFSAATAANFVSAIGVASIIGKLLLGNLGDRIGNRNIYLVCFSLVAAALFWVNYGPATWGVYPFVVVFGIAYGGCSASQSPLIASLYGLKAHGQIVGATNNGYTIGATTGPLVCGYLFDLTGSYRIAFLVIAVIALSGLILAIMLQPVRRRHR